MTAAAVKQHVDNVMTGECDDDRNDVTNSQDSKTEKTHFSISKFSEKVGLLKLELQNSVVSDISKGEANSFNRLSVEIS